MTDSEQKTIDQSRFRALTEHPYVSVHFDAGSTFALTGENAGCWVEGGPNYVPIEQAVALRAEVTKLRSIITRARARFGESQDGDAYVDDDMDKILMEASK